MVYATSTKQPFVSDKPLKTRTSFNKRTKELMEFMHTHKISVLTDSSSGQIIVTAKEK